MITANHTGRVSVVIPVAEWRDYVSRAVNSALGQGNIVREVLLVDNSIDNAEKMCFDDARVRVLRSDKDLDAAHARNLGNDAATAEFIAVLDSDDEYLPGHIDSSVSELDSDSKIDLVYSSYINKTERSEELVVAHQLTLARLIRNCPIGHSTVVYRNSEFFRYPEIGTRHDYALWLIGLAANKIFVGISMPSVVRHKRNNSFSDIGYIALVKRHIKVTRMYSGRTPTMCLQDTLVMICLKVVRLLKAKL